MELTNLQAFCQRLNIQYRPELLPFYLRGRELLDTRNNAITDTRRLIRLNEKYRFFRKWFSDLLAAAKAVESDRDLLLFTYILYDIIRCDASPALLDIPDRQQLDTDFAPAFSLLYFLEAMIADMEARGLPFDIISDTLHGFDAEIDDYYAAHGRSGLRCFVNWFLLFIHGKIIRVGRLNFEIKTLNSPIRVYRKEDTVKILMDDVSLHKKGMFFGSAGQDDETGKYHASITEGDGWVSGFAANQYGEVDPQRITLHGYQEVLRKGDPVIGVHIPAVDPFTPELVADSFRRAKLIFSQYYPEFHYKAFQCESWMMEKRLEDILQKKTNITRFIDLFTCYPMLSDGNWVYSNVFHVVPPIPPAQLPETTSMQKKVKAYLMAGNYYHSKCGIILPDHIHE